MKKLIAALSLGMLVAGSSVYAQTTTPKQDQKPRSEMRKAMKDKSPEEMAQMRTDRMAKRYDLSANQKNQLQALNTRQAQEMKAKREGYKASAERTPEQKAQMQEARKANQDKYQAEFKNILTADQYAKYEADEAQMKEKRAEARKGGKSGEHKKRGEYKKQQGK